MNLRDAATSRFGRPVARALRRFNDRHPWSHNDAFHPWILTRLPNLRGRALDVGCGRGDLLVLLAEHFEAAEGLDADPRMRAASRRRCAGMPNVNVAGTDLADVTGGADLVTMVAALHHLNLPGALTQVHRVLRPGGRFLCVGLARPASPVDLAWDAASMVTNPLIGYVRHPWATDRPHGPDPFPVKDPELTFGQIRRAVESELPGATMRHHLGFRHTIEWTKPARLA